MFFCHFEIHKSALSSLKLHSRHASMHLKSSVYRLTCMSLTCSSLNSSFSVILSQLHISVPCLQSCLLAPPLPSPKSATASFEDIWSDKGSASFSFSVNRKHKNLYCAFKHCFIVGHVLQLEFPPKERGFRAVANLDFK